jgi:hypothetical protein
MDWIRVAQDRVQWLAFVNTVMNLRVPSNVGENSCVDERLAASQEGLSSVSKQATLKHVCNSF